MKQSRYWPRGLAVSLVMVLMLRPAPWRPVASAEEPESASEQTQRLLSQFEDLTVRSLSLRKALEAERLRLAREVQATTRAFTQVLQAVARLTQERTQLVARAKGLEERLAQTAQRLTVSAQEQQRLKETVDTLGKEKTTTQTQEAAFAAEVKALQVERHRLVEEGQAMRQGQLTLQAKLDAATQTIKHLEQARQELATKLEATAGAFTQAQRQLAGLTMERTNLEGQAKALEGQLTERGKRHMTAEEAQPQPLASRLNAAEQEKQRLKKVVAALEQGKATALDRTTILTAEVKELREERLRLVEDAEALGQVLAALTKRQEQLTTQANLQTATQTLEGVKRVKQTLTAEPEAASGALRHEREAAKVPPWGRDPFVLSTTLAGGEGQEDIETQLRLSAIILGAKRAVAIINNRVARVGDMIEGRHVVKILRDRVIVRDETGDKTLPLNPGGPGP